ncbi:MAG: hypothetical protein V3T01_01260, partial [Myxococcota bacterium]
RHHRSREQLPHPRKHPGRTYTSFTVETGAQDGHLSKGVISTLNDAEFDVAPDGSFEIVVAHRDPGTPNWIDAAGVRTGMIFWRFLLPKEEVPLIEANVVDVGTLS